MDVSYNQLQNICRSVKLQLPYKQVEQATEFAEFVYSVKL